MKKKSKKRHSRRWLRTNEYGEIKHTLRACISFAESIPKDITYWKWLILGVHNAMQGCMVVALTRSDGLGAFKAKDETAWLIAYRADKPPPDRMSLLSFPELFKKIQLPGGELSAPFVPAGNQEWSAKKLNQIRNEFSHFSPKGWSLQMRGLPDIADDCLAVCDYLVTHTGRLVIFGGYREGELPRLIKRLRAKIANC